MHERNLLKCVVLVSCRHWYVNMGLLFTRFNSYVRTMHLFVFCLINVCVMVNI